MKKTNAPAAKRYGVFYTPEVIAMAMTRSAIELYLSTHQDIRNIKILDLSCGNGRFLRAAFEVLMEKWSALAPQKSAETLKREICAHSLYGIDRDGGALDELRQILSIEHLAQKDALLSALPEKAFDIVLGNPPYVSYGLRNTGKLTASDAALLREKFPDSAEYKIATYALFMELGVRALRPGGVLSYLVPDSFLTGRYFSKLRNFLLRETGLQKLYLIRKKIFPAVPGACVILEAKRGAANAKHTVQCAELSEKADLLAPAYKILQNEFEANDLQRFILFFDDGAHELVRHLNAAQKCTLGDVLTLASGLIGRRGQKSIAWRGDAPPGALWRRGITSGAAIQPGKSVPWSGDWLNTAPEAIKSGLGKVDYAKPKLFFRQTGDRILCAVDRTGLYALNNVHVGVPKDPACNLEALAEYLNGEEMRQYYQSVTMEAKRPLAQIDLEILRKMPLTGKVTDAILSIKKVTDN